MIRFKKSAAGDVPAPPAGYATLFVDTATGLPAAKDSTGTVIPLKGADGAALPAGGTAGQVLTKTSDSAAWADAPAGDTPAGTWMSLLPPDGEIIGGTEGEALATGGINLESGETLELTLSLPTGTQVASRVRGSAEVVLDVTTSGSAGEFALVIGNQNVLAEAQTFPITQGSNAISFDFPIGQDYGSSIDVPFAVVQLAGSADIASAWASLHVTQCDVLLEDTGTVITSDVTMTQFAVIGNDSGGSGGCHIVKAGTLAAATTIEVVGYYSARADDLASTGATGFYLPRRNGDYVLVDPPAAIPVFDSGYPEFDGMWGWTSSNPFKDNLPPDQWSVCEVKIDGGAPVFALLSNMAGF